MNQLHLLYHLQETDHEITAKKQRLREVLLAQKGNPALDQARQRRAESEEMLGDARARQKDLELQLAQIVDKRRRSSDRLYSGKVTNPKELSDLQHEIDSLARRRSDLEDEVLEAMLEAETAQEQDAAARDYLAEVEEEWAQQKEALAAEQDQLANRLNTLIEKRQQQAARIEPKFLTAYDSTRQKRGGVAMAVVQDGSCQVCSVRISSSKVSLAQTGALARCGSCDRILVIR